MTQHTSSNALRFRKALPWILAALALFGYLATMNHWVTVSGLGIASAVANWEGQPTALAPLFYLVTLPLRWFSGNNLFLGLNFLSALFGALTLGLLARSIQLLPHDRTREQRLRQTNDAAILVGSFAWWPPVAAVLICGLQLTFWENATTATLDMLDLLVFAYLVRCLLEYRVDQRESWLAKLAFVYGLGVTNGWALIGYFPLFLVALIWIRGLSFFNVRFLLKMLGLGTAGLLLYFLLPLVIVTTGKGDTTFWMALKANLGWQKTWTINNPFFQYLRVDLFTLSLTSLIPLLLISVRWPTLVGDISTFATNLTTWAFGLVHLALLGFCAVIFFDPPFSGRELGRGAVPFLSFYYLAALVIGYCLGYVLLVFGRGLDQKWRRAHPLQRWTNLGLAVVALAGIAAVPGLLVKKNLPAIRTANGPALRHFAENLNASLPAQPSVVLSDEPAFLPLLKAVWQSAGTQPGHLLLETRSMALPAYHELLKKQHPAWADELLPPVTAKKVEDNVLADLLARLSGKHPVYYLHPSFGYYFEGFRPEPDGLVLKMHAWPPEDSGVVQLTTNIIGKNEAFWSRVRSEESGLRAEAGGQATLRKWYARAENNWGVTLQQAGRLPEAAAHFEQAGRLDPLNVVAAINLRFNAILQKGGAVHAVETDETLLRQIKSYPSIMAALSQCGPIDELEVSFQLGVLMIRSGNVRQGLLLLERVFTLSPLTGNARQILTEIYGRKADAGKLLAMAERIRTAWGDRPLEGDLDLETTKMEAAAVATKGDVAKAEQMLRDLQTRHPEDLRPVTMLADFYVIAKRQDEAVAAFETRLRKNPKDSMAYLGLANLYIQAGQKERALKPLDDLLAQDGQHLLGLLNRALLQLELGRLEGAKQDYEAIARFHSARKVDFSYGLGTIADKQGERAEALRQYGDFLLIANTNTPQYRQVQARLQELGAEKK